MEVHQILDATTIPPLKSICDDYINTIGGHAYNPDCEQPEFFFTNCAEYGTHSLYPLQVHCAYRPYRRNFKLLNLEQKSCKFMQQVNCHENSIHYEIL